MLKKTRVILLCLTLILSAKDIKAQEHYDPPFELRGVVKKVNGNFLEINLPHINQDVGVFVAPDALILNKIDENAVPQKLAAIQIEDLVIINGVIKGKDFYSQKIYFLTTNSNSSKKP
ncbi:MAG: hypothetical protein HY810_04155 [Candidatus Omnitrophica bacterium]|nr:hypothetical protein [Candidatus Omnitrophota bacterium]